MPGGRFHGGMRRVKLPLFMTLLSAPLAQAALTASVVTNKGTILVDLQYAKTPKTVANFITMAQGTRARLDAKTGEVIKKPLYVGEKFFRVINGTTDDPNFKIIQTGSGTGTNAGNPGFTFKDEFDPTLTHVPYVLSMANGGPNTNGSQIFFTGSAPIDYLNDVHTVFGLVNDAPSRAVINAILAAGNDATTITAVTFNRTDAPAQAFNELAQNLPTLSVPDGSLAVLMGQSSTWNFKTPIGTGTMFRAFQSNDMSPNSWTELADAKRQIGIGPVATPPTLASVQLDAAPAGKAFYHLSTAVHPESVAPTSLASRVVVVDLGPNGTMTYTFSASGTGGTYSLAPPSGAPIQGNFTSVDSFFGSTSSPVYPTSLGCHDISFIASHVGLNPKEFWYKIGCDTATTSLINGHFSFQIRAGFPNSWQSAGTSTLTISR